MPTKTAQECLASAADCERMAAEALTQDYRDVFLALAARWKSLGEEQHEMDRREVSMELIPKMRTTSVAN